MSFNPHKVPISSLKKLFSFFQRWKLWLKKCSHFLGSQRSHTAGPGLEASSAGHRRDLPGDRASTRLQQVPGASVSDLKTPLHHGLPLPGHMVPTAHFPSVGPEPASKEMKSTQLPRRSTGSRVWGQWWAEDLSAPQPGWKLSPVGRRMRCTS